MPEKEKPETPAETYIRIRRMQYAEMYPTDFHLLLRMMSTNDDDWNKAGLIHCTYNENPPENSLTDVGWKSVKNVTRCPTSWPEAYKHSPLLNIPDNADESWLHEIGMFCYHLKNWERQHVRQWIEVASRLTSMGNTYQDAQILRNQKGYQSVVDAVKDHQVEARIAEIQRMRYEEKLGKQPKTFQVESGALVRFATGTERALVQAVTAVPGSRYKGNDTSSLAILDRPINGSHMHFTENLIALDPEKETTPLDEPKD